MRTKKKHKTTHEDRLKKLTVRLFKVRGELQAYKSFALAINEFLREEISWSAFRGCVFLTDQLSEKNITVLDQSIPLDKRLAYLRKELVTYIYSLKEKDNKVP
jgi:hypothetical protein